MHGRALAVLLAALLALAGCGSSDDDRAAEDHPGVRQTIERYYEDVASGNASGVCAVLTEQAKKGFDEIFEGPHASGCEGNAKELSRMSLPMRGLTVSRVQITGDEATAHVSFKRPRGFESDVPLVREDGTWKFAYIPANAQKLPPGVE
jgi:hypothetical protein